MSMYPDVYEFADSFAMESDTFMTTFFVVYFVFILLMYLYSLVVYILQSLGLYTIANRRGIHHPWLAWIPVGSVWILGSIADQYQYVAKGKVKNRRKVLLGLAIATAALVLVFFAVFIVLMVTLIQSEFSTSVDESQLILPVVLTLIVYLVMVVLSLISLVFQYVCYYDLYASCSPNNAVAFLILSIFFTFLQPFFVFAVRKKDQGMPPRKPVAPAPTWQPAPAPAQPAWQNPVPPQPTWQPPVPPQPPVWQPPVAPPQPPVSPVQEETPEVNEE